MNIKATNRKKVTVMMDTNADALRISALMRKAGFEGVYRKSKVTVVGYIKNEIIDTRTANIVLQMGKYDRAVEMMKALFMPEAQLPKTIADVWGSEDDWWEGPVAKLPCPRCKSDIFLDSTIWPVNIECKECHARGTLKSQPKSLVLVDGWDASWD